MRTACLVAVAWTLLGAAPASAGTVLVSGTLTGAAGMPAPGTIRVYAWPHSSSAMTLPLAGTAQAGAGGEFTVLAADPRGLLELANQRGGRLDFTATAETISGRGEWTFTGYVARTADGVRVGAADAVARAAEGVRVGAADAVARTAIGVRVGAADSRSGVARITAHAPAPRIAIRATRPRPLIATASRDGGPPCRNERHVTEPKYTRAPAVVGELNNAYNDGTRATFTYGRAHSADTEFGVAVSSDGGDTWFIGGENHISDYGSVTFPPATRRYARKLRTLFEFSHQKARNNTCAVWDHYIRATSWIGGTDTDLRQPGALNRCDARYLGDGFEGGVEFHRARNNAVRWSRGASAFGVHLTTRSGFSENVRLDYTFGGSTRKNHYLCGPDGRSSPYESGRVFSGALR
jgi:hypothetical protein